MTVEQDAKVATSPVINIVELTIITLAAIFSLTFSLVLAVVKFLMINLPFTYAVTCFCHILTNLFVIYNKNDIVISAFSNIICTGLFASAMNMFLIFIERCIATYLARSYEQMEQGFPFLVALMTSCQWTLVLVIGIFTVFQLVSNQILVIASLVLEVIVCVGLFLIPVRAYRQYAAAGRQIQEHTLSERYQLSENYKSSKILNRVVFALCVTTSFATLVYYLGHFALVQVVDARFIDFSFTGALVLQAMCVPVLISILNKKFRSKISKTFCKPSQVEHAVHVRNLKGNDLVVRVESQRDVYFQSYQNAWR